MDYEKKYKEALEFFKHIYPNIGGELKEQIENLFPELAESEDEEIWKTLIDYMTSVIDINGIKGDTIIAWLEKQKPVKWSERDDAYFAICKNALYEYHKLDKGGVEITIEWLESLKKRMGNDYDSNKY